MIRTKNALTQALFDLLAEKSFDKITVTELARRANVDRKTFYLHYQTVGDILEEFYEVHLAKLQETLEREQEHIGQDVAGLFQVLNGLLDENLALYRNLAQGPACDFFRDRLEKTLKTRILSLLEQEVQESPQRLALYAEFFTAGILSVYLAWLREELPVSERDLAAATSRALMSGAGGIAPRLGR